MLGLAIFLLPIKASISCLRIKSRLVVLSRLRTTTSPLRSLQQSCEIFALLSCIPSSELLVFRNVFTWGQIMKNAVVLMEIYRFHRCPLKKTSATAGTASTGALHFTGSWIWTFPEVFIKRERSFMLKEQIRHNNSLL